MVRETGLEFNQIIHPRSILPHDVERCKKKNQYLVVLINDNKPCVFTVWVRSDEDFAVYRTIYPNQVLAGESENRGQNTKKEDINMTRFPKEMTENGIHYTLHGGYYFPDLALPESSRQPIGRYGRMRDAYLKEYRPACMSGSFCPGSCTITWRKPTPAALAEWNG